MGIITHETRKRYERKVLKNNNYEHDYREAQRKIPIQNLKGSLLRVYTATLNVYKNYLSFKS